MHGLVNKSIERFILDTYGTNVWATVSRSMGETDLCFDALWPYPDDVTFHLIAASAQAVPKHVDDLLEDLGTYLVSHANCEHIRRLLRFGGVDFVDFVVSLEDIPDRATLALDDLILPRLEVISQTETEYRIKVQPIWRGFATVLAGALRAMADDYGALVFIDRVSPEVGWDHINLILFDTSFAEGRSFSLSSEVYK